MSSSSSSARDHWWTRRIHCGEDSGQPAVLWQAPVPHQMGRILVPGQIMGTCRQHLCSRHDCRISPDLSRSSPENQDPTFSIHSIQNSITSNCVELLHFWRGDGCKGTHISSSAFFRIKLRTKLQTTLQNIGLTPSPSLHPILRSSPVLLQTPPPPGEHPWTSPLNSSVSSCILFIIHHYITLFIIHHSAHHIINYYYSFRTLLI
jgi:hypothetical protein